MSKSSNPVSPLLMIVIVTNFDIIVVVCKWCQTVPIKIGFEEVIACRRLDSLFNQLALRLRDFPQLSSPVNKHWTTNVQQWINIWIWIIGFLQGVCCWKSPKNLGEELGWSLPSTISKILALTVQKREPYFKQVPYRFYSYPVSYTWTT